MPASRKPRDKRPLGVPYSDWQLALLRSALYGYKVFRRHKKQQQTWQQVTQSLREHSHLDIYEDMLRKFVEGVRQPDGTRIPQVPLAHHLDAIVRFLTSPEIGELTMTELETQEIGYRAALRLAEHLTAGLDRGDAPRPIMSGHYRAERTEGTIAVVVDIAIGHPSADGRMEVVQTQRTFRPESSARLPTLLPTQRRAAALGTERHLGWALQTPEDSVLFFLKKEDTDENLYYAMLAGDAVPVAGAHPTELVLLSHAYPFPIPRHRRRYDQEAKPHNTESDEQDEPRTVTLNLPGSNKAPRPVDWPRWLAVAVSEDVAEDNLHVFRRISP